MSDPVPSVQDEILAAATARLREDDRIQALVGKRVFDRLPAERVEFPYLTLDRVDGIPERAECVEGEDVTLTFSAWSRPEPPSIGKREAARIVATATLVLTGEDLVLTSFRLIDAAPEPSQVFPDPDGLTQHGVGGVTFLTEPAA